MSKKVVRVFFDTETYTNYKEISLPYLIGWVTDLDFNDFQYSLEPHDEFFETLAELSEIYDVQLWAHNAQYDLHQIYPTYLAKMPHHNSNRTWQTTENGNLLKFLYRGKDGNKIKFQAFCTYKWNKGSLASWAESMNLDIKKGEIDYEKHEYCRLADGRFYYKNRKGEEKSCLLEDELDYLENDVYILYKVWETISNQKKDILDLYGFKKERRDPTTIPAFGKLLVNKLMGGNDRLDLYSMTYKNHVDKDVGVIMENTRMGGFTAYNRNIPYINAVKAVIRTYDINSMYPWIMSKGLPFGDFVDKSSTTMTWFLCTMTKVNWKKDYNFFSREPVPQRFLKSPVFMCEMFLDIIREVSDNDIQVLGEYYQECGSRPELDKLISRLYEIKADPNVSMYTKQSCKTTMNSQFGKFMERNHHKDYFYNIEGGFFEEFIPLEPRPYKNNLTGCYIVQVAQSILIHHVIEEHKRGNKFIYCDTDSLKIVEQQPPLFSVGSDMGEWKHEGDFHIYMNNGKAKKYFLWNHDYPIEKQQIKMSGIDGSVFNWMVKNFTLEDYMTMYNRANNVLIINGKMCRKNSVLGQPLLGRTNIEFNKGIPITHHLDITKEKYLWKIED